MKAVNAVGVATVTDKNGAVTEHQTQLGLVVDEGPLSEVAVEMSYTKNLGNYQSARMQVSLKVPASPTPESMESAFEYAKQWVEDRLAKLVQEVEKTVG